MPSVSIAKIIPPITEAQLFTRKKCYIGISVENPLFEGQALRAMLAWAAGKFEQTLVIVGDYLNRFNERIIYGCDLDKAGELGIKLGDVFVLRTKELFDSLPAGKVCLTRWKEHLQQEDFHTAKKVIDGLFKTNEEFEAAVEYDALSFVKRQKKRSKNFAVGMEEAIRLSSEYILEEAAVFSSLSQRGFSVELYPGPELRVLAQVAKGQYPDIPAGLKTRINVELKLSGAV